MATVTFKGSPVQLCGELPKTGDAAPKFGGVKGDLTTVHLPELLGKKVVLNIFPSLDTPVCDLEVKRFNKEAAALSDKVAIVAVSRDLPFAQARWCGAADVKAVETLSDYRDGSFGKSYGLYVKELDLLCRAIVIVKDGKVAYTQVVSEMTEQPDFDAVLQAVKALV